MALWDHYKRTSHLPFVGSPLPMISVLAVYLLFVLKVGPKLMENRKPYQLKRTMQIYNVLQVLINLYCFLASLWNYYGEYKFSLSCEPYDANNINPKVMYLRYPSYVYFVSKYLDLLDTVFFVLRKKYNQITFLHIYHHTSMVYAVWVYLTLLFGSHFTMIGNVNSFIHIVMYTYYFIAALNLDMDLTPFKKVLTKLQICQFCWLAIHFFKPILNNLCHLDPFWIWVTFLQNSFMLVLFIDFYIRAYVRRPRRERELAASKVS